MLSNHNDKPNVLEQIDEFFNSKKPSEARMFLGVIALGIAYGIYQFVFLQTDADLTATQNKISGVQQKINVEKNYLNTHSIAMLSKNKKSLKVKKQTFDDTLYKMSYVDNTLTELSYLLFDDKSWANFVDNISYLAKKYHVDIEEIGNKFYTPTFQKITHVVEVDVKSNAKIKDMVKFLNAIEESPLVVDVNDIKLSQPKNRVEGSFKIAVWGMKY